MKEFMYLISRIAPEWSALNRLGKSRALRSSWIWLVLVPIVAKLLAKTERVHTLSILGASFTFELGLPFSWKLFYYSSILFSVSSLFYALRCPPIVRDYERYSDLEEEGKTGRYIISAYRKALWRRGRFSFDPNREEVLVTRFINTYKSGDAQVGVDDSSEGFYERHPIERLDGIDLAEDKLSDAFWYVRDWADRSFPFMRLVCGFCYLAGFALLGVVVAQNFLYVWKLTF